MLNRPAAVAVDDAAPAVDWREAPLAVLVDHIMATYHDPLRPELQRLGALADKVARVHGPEPAFTAQRRHTCEAQ